MKNNEIFSIIRLGTYEQYEKKIVSENPELINYQESKHVENHSLTQLIEK